MKLMCSVKLMVSGILFRGNFLSLGEKISSGIFINDDFGLILNSSCETVVWDLKTQRPRRNIIPSTVNKKIRKFIRMAPQSSNVIGVSEDHIVVILDQDFKRTEFKMETGTN